MYSMNGRFRKEAERASIDNDKRHVLKCKDCGNSMPKKSREFGEEVFCDKCGSKNLTYTLNES